MVTLNPMVLEDSVVFLDILIKFKFNYMATNNLNPNIDSANTMGSASPWWTTCPSAAMG